MAVVQPWLVELENLYRALSHNGNMMKQEWQMTILGIMTSPVKHAWKPGQEELPYIGLEHIEEQLLKLNGFGNSKTVESNKFRFMSGDILFGKLRPYFRKIVRIDFEGVCSTDIWVFRAHKGFDQRFLFYFLANPLFVDKATKASSGTKMPRADWKYLESTEWAVPPLLEQKAIADVLSSLDDKIELLRRQNETLEKIAQTIFKEWFVEFNFPDKNGKPYKSSGGKMTDCELGEIPEGWKVGSYDDLAEVTTGKGLNKEYIKPNGQYAVLGANGELGRSDSYLHDEELVLTGRVGTLGTVYLSTGKAWISDNVLISRARRPSDTFYCLLSLKRVRLATLNRGSTQPLITQTDLKNIPMVIPSDSIRSKWSAAVAGITGKLSSSHKQTITLSAMRDALLPKLMSGQVRVNN